MKRLLVMLCLFLLPSSAAAQSVRLAEGIRRADDADFQGALDLLDQAEAEQLSRNDLVALLTYRAYVRFALGQRNEMREDLTMLAAIEPEARLPASYPPPVRRAFARITRSGVTPPALEALVDEGPGGARVEIRSSGEGTVVREVRLFAREAPAQRFRQVPNNLLIAGPDHRAIDWYAELVGPGSVVLASEGTEESPRRIASLALDRVTTIPVEPVRGDDTVLHWLLGVSGFALVAGGVLAGVLLAVDGQSSSTAVTGPSIEW